MTDKQPEALLIADDMDDIGEHQAAAELRRLHEVNTQLVEALKDIIADPETQLSKEDWSRAKAAIAKATGEQQ